MKKLIAVACAVFVLTHAQGATITEWTFEDVIAPSTGAGTASLLGGTTSTFATGSGGGRGWNTTTYAAQGTGSGTRGVQFLLGTVGYEGITLSFDQRASGTSSRWAQVDYTLDGGASWVLGYWNNGGGLSPHDSFYNFEVDFSSIAGANNNANFGVRIVSIYSPVAFDQNASLADYAADAAYMRANADAGFSAGSGLGTGDYGTSGTWRFDNVNFSGSVIPEPASSLLAAGAGFLLWAGRRRRLTA